MRNKEEEATCKQQSGSSSRCSILFKSHFWNGGVLNHQLKLRDSKCKFSAKLDEQAAATSCLIFFGPHTRTPTLGSLHSNKIPARANPLTSLDFMEIVQENFKKKTKRRESFAVTKKAQKNFATPECGVIGLWSSWLDESLIRGECCTV